MRNIEKAGEPVFLRAFYFRAFVFLFLLIPGCLQQIKNGGHGRDGAVHIGFGVSRGGHAT
jgi:hypothetical protein